MDELRGTERETKIERSNYISEEYLNPIVWNSYLCQIQYIRSLMQNGSIIEIGMGGGIINAVLRKLGYSANTMDVNEHLKPDFVASISSDFSGFGKTFDCVLCAEVLEHIPFELFEKCLGNISSLSNKYAVITLPDCRYRNKLKIQYNNRTVTRYLWKRNNKIFSGHCWELNYREEMSIMNISTVIKKHFSIIKQGIEEATPYHYYWLLEKRQ